MTQNVEIFSTLCKPYRRDSLNSLVRRFSAISVAMEGDHLKREIGDRLRQAREALGFDNMAEFARLHGLSRDKLNHWEKGRYYPDPAFVVTLWERYRITADWIYLGVIAGLPHSLGESLRAGAQAEAAASPGVGSPSAKIHEHG